MAMKIAIGLAVLVSVPVLAQGAGRGQWVGGGQSGRWVGPVAVQPQPTVGLVSGRPSPFGNVLFPGTGGPPGQGIYGSGPFGPNHQPIVVGGTGRGGVIAVPFAFPVAVSGGTYGYGGVNPPQTPSVVINQNFAADVARPVVRDYEELPEPVRRAPVAVEPHGRVDSPPAAESFYEIVFRDGTSQRAAGYAVSGDTLIFVSDRGRKTTVTLDQIDLARTETANRARGLDFQI
jgi:hypothetical protein